MKPKVNIITLAVDNLERSFNFYCKGLGLPEPWNYKNEKISDDHLALKFNDGLSLVFYLRSEMENISGKTDTMNSTSGFMLSYPAENKEEVDDLLKKAAAWGGTVIGEPKEEQWGYFGYFKDPDSHMWEIICVPVFSRANK